jgi:hypothetical protein
MPTTPTVSGVCVAKTTFGGACRSPTFVATWANWQNLYRRFQPPNAVPMWGSLYPPLTDSTRMPSTWYSQLICFGRQGNSALSTPEVIIVTSWPLATR